MEDLVDAVADELLEINEEQKGRPCANSGIYRRKREKSRREERKILTALAFMGEVISGEFHLRLKENQELNFLTEKSVLKVQETNKIRELFRAIFEFPENPIEIG